MANEELYSSPIVRLLNTVTESSLALSMFALNEGQIDSCYIYRILIDLFDPYSTVTFDFDNLWYQRTFFAADYVEFLEPDCKLITANVFALMDEVS